jgi:hypothetical protein
VKQQRPSVTPTPLPLSQLCPISSPCHPTHSIHTNLYTPTPLPLPSIHPAISSSKQMQSLSRLPYIPVSLTRNKKLDTATSLTGNDTSDPSLSADTTIHHVHRAPLAQIDQLLFTPSSTDLISPALTPLSRASFESIPPTTRSIGKPMTTRRSSYTGEDGLYSAGGSSQSSVYRRSSQYVVQISLVSFSPSFLFPLPSVTSAFFLTPVGVSQLMSDTGCVLMAVSTPLGEVPLHPLAPGRSFYAVSQSGLFFPPIWTTVVAMGT